MNRDQPPTHNPETLRKHRPPVSRVRRLTRVFGGAAVLYVLAVAYLCLNETRLVYPGRAPTIGNWSPTFPREEVQFTSADGTPLVGWFIPQPNALRTVLIFHGNQENVATTSSNYARRLGDELRADVFVFDYRGFGKSLGVPAETQVIEDGLAAVDWLQAKTGKSSSEMLFFGSSLGGGVAVAVAQQRRPQLLILDRTFDSLVATASENYPWVPVGWLMRNRFPSLERIKSLDVPLFISHFATDELISVKSARRLYEAAPSLRKTFYEMPVGHHLQPLPEEYWPKLREFVDAHSHSPPVQEDPIP